MTIKELSALDQPAVPEARYLLSATFPAQKHTNSKQM